MQVTPLGPITVKGLDEADRDVRADRRRLPRGPALQAAAARGLTRFVGRDAEIGAAPRGRWSRRAAATARWSRIVGEPGVGKSRLVWEFTHSHRTHGWLVIESGSVSYGKATAYLPVIDLLKAYFQIDDRDDVARRSGRR